MKEMLTPEEKIKVIEKYKLHKADTGSPEVQVALLSEEIKRLVLHLKSHKKDLHSKRGLLKMISKRKKFLRYLEKEYPRRYKKILEKIKI